MFDYNNAYGLDDYLNNESFFRVYWAIFDDPQYKSLSFVAKILYCYVKNNMGLSMDPNNKNREHYIDEKGKFFCFANQQKVADRLGLGKSTIKRAFDELKKIGLIGVRRSKIGDANRYYLCKFSRVKMNLAKGQNEPCRGQNEPCARGQNEPCRGQNEPLQEEQQYNIDQKNNLRKKNNNKNVVANAPSVSVVASKEDKDLSKDTEMKKEEGCQPRISDSTLSTSPQSNSLAEADAIKGLQAVGITRTKAEAMLHQYGADRIARALRYVAAYRQATNRAGLLIRAIEGDWGSSATSNAYDDVNERMTSYDSPTTSYEPSDFAANLALHEEEARARGRALLAKLCGGTH